MKPLSCLSALQVKFLLNYNVFMSCQTCHWALKSSLCRLRPRFFRRVCLGGRENTVGLEEGVYETPCTRKINMWQLIYKDTENIFIFVLIKEEKGLTFTLSR